MNITFKCSCGKHSVLRGLSQIKLYWLGLWPARCQHCADLQPAPELHLPQDLERKIRQSVMHKL